MSRVELDVYQMIRRLCAEIPDARQHEATYQGPEFTAMAVRDRLGHIAVKTLFIEPESPWGNGCDERPNGKLRDELLPGRSSTTWGQGQVLVETWRIQNEQFPPHGSLGYRPPAPEAAQA